MGPPATATTTSQLLLAALLLLLLLPGLTSAAGKVDSFNYRDGSKMSPTGNPLKITFLTGDLYRTHADSSHMTAPPDSLNQRVDLCPPMALWFPVHRWFFKPHDGADFQPIIIAQGDRQFAFVPDVHITSKGCLNVNLTEEWYGDFWYTPDHKVKTWIENPPPRGYFPPPRPSNPQIELVHTDGMQVMTFCPPLRDLLARRGAIRWHIEDPGKSPREVAYIHRGLSHYYGTPYHAFHMQNVLNHDASPLFYTTSCIKTTLESGRALFLTTSSDSAGNKDIRRYIWVGYKTLPEETFRPGFMGRLVNPNTFYNSPLRQDYFTTHMTNYLKLLDMEQRKYTHGWEEGQSIELCGDYSTEGYPAYWIFRPWFHEKELPDITYSPVVASSVDWNLFPDLVQSVVVAPGIIYGHRCITLQSMGNDLAGTWVHTAAKHDIATYHRMAPHGHAQKPQDTTRVAFASVGESNVYICPSRLAQLLWGEINIQLMDPVTKRHVTLFTRESWYDGAFLNGGGYTFRVYTDLALQDGRSSCLYIPTVRYEHLGIYKIYVKGRYSSSKWTETVDLRPRPTGGRHRRSLAVSTEQQAPEVMLAAPLCDGCYTFTWGYNTKYVYHNQWVALQGINKDSERCSLTWVNPRDMPVAVYSNGTVHWTQHAPRSDNYAVNYDNGNLMIQRFSKEDEGVWKGLLTCADPAKSKVMLNRLFLVNSVQYLQTQLFDQFTFPHVMAPKDSVSIRLNDAPPSCFNGSHPRCYYSHETGQIHVDFVTESDMGIWVVNHSRVGSPSYVQVFALSPATPEGCFTPQKPNGMGILSLGIDIGAKDKVIWFRQDSVTNDTLTPVAWAEGGYSKAPLDEALFPYFNGNLWVPKNECGLYWALVYTTDDFRHPTHLRLFAVECEGERSPPAYFCPPIYPFAKVGELVESIRPQREILNHTLFVLRKPRYSDTMQVVCYAEDGHTLWDRPRRYSAKCNFDGSYNVTRKADCGQNYMLTFDFTTLDVDSEPASRVASARLVRNYIRCSPPNARNRKRQRRRVGPAHTTAATAAAATQEPPLEVETLTASYRVELPEQLNALLNMSAEMLFDAADEVANATAAAAATAHLTQQPLPPLVVFPITNFNTTSVVVSSLLILCLFFALWLVCKWKKHKRGAQQHNHYYPSPPEYDDRAPIYKPEKELP